MAPSIMEAIHCNQPATRLLAYHSEEWHHIGDSVLFSGASRLGTQVVVVMTGHKMAAFPTHTNTNLTEISRTTR